MYLRPLLVLLLFCALYVSSHLVHRWGRRAGRSRPCLTGGLRLDLLYWVLTPTVSAWLSRVLTALMLAAVGGLIWADPSHAWTGYGVASTLPRWVRPAAALICADFANYWLHRAQHLPLLWPIHAIHHSSVELDWHSALRIHPLDRAMMQAGALGFLLLLGFPLGSLALAAPVAFLLGVLVHTDTDVDLGRLSYWVATPAFHRWHHSQDSDAMGKNFSGILPLWDLLFGTFHLPEGRRPGNFGAGEAVPESLGAQLVHPFLALWRRKRGSSPPIS